MVGVNIVNLLQLTLYITGFGFLAYLLCSAIKYCFSFSTTSTTSTTSTDNKHFKGQNISESYSTPNLLMSLDKQLKELNLQVLPKKLGDFDKGEIQSLIDNSVVGRYEFIGSNGDSGTYKVTVEDESLGKYKTNYDVSEICSVTDVPKAISDMLYAEFESIAGRQACKTDHYYLKDNGVEAEKGVVLAKRKLIIKHNHVGDPKFDRSRTFKVAKNDLLIPIKNIENKFLSYLVVNSEKAKNIRIASSIRGGFFSIGDFPNSCNEYILCEDYLAACTLHRATNKTAIVCFDVQNIDEVAKSILFKFANSKLIFATSKDILSKNQYRLKKGLKYSSSYNMPFIFPVFPVGKQFEHLKNWNELQNLKCDNEIKELVDLQLEYFEREGKEVAINQVLKKYHIISYE